MKVATRRSRAVKTLEDNLAAIFTASAIFKGHVFKPEGFSISYDSLSYTSNGDEPEQDLEFALPFTGECTRYCCGLLEIGSFDERMTPTKDPAVNSAIMDVFMAAIAQRYNMVFGTVVTSQKAAKMALLANGFSEVADFRSKTTKNQITVLMRDLSATKFLPTAMRLSELDLDSN